ncbi:AAA family ATPase [Mobiluncus mulieris]|uniref:AAA family ATPase n=1 Tax=Mobiluncus mulieris TaxID=2052 RepID=A0A7Y0UV76_9ACTO|nr:AAA family ATPase [Mobiluncus mulieris]NMX04384.1 AAA family ATPase [Mobiluncus mulieris]
MAIRSFRIRNLLSIRDTTLELVTPVTLLIGPNGAGKTNLLRGIELLSRLVDDTFQDEIMRGGGFSEHFFQGSPVADFDSAEQGGGFDSRCFAIDADYRINETLTNGYDVQFSRGTGDTALVRERLFFHNQAKYTTPFCDDFQGNHGWLPLAHRSVLSDADDCGSRTGVQENIRRILTGCRVFHFDDSSSRSPMLQSCDVADNLRLHSDGRNLAAVLWRMRESDVERYEGILRSVRVVAPFLEDFEVDPVYEGSRNTILRWRQKGLDGVFSGERLSSGTLRFICLTVLLQQTNPPETIVLDEPELGLHPFAIYQLAEMLHEFASPERKIIVTTQSVTLANQFSLEELALVTRENGATVVNRPEPEDYTQWLDDYSVGQMWENNVLNVSPKREVTDL